MRYRFLPVCRVLGMLLALFSLSYLLPLASALIYADGTLVDFLTAMGATFGSGVALWFFTRKHRRELKPRDGFLLVTLGWIAIAAIATLPLLLVIQPLGFTGAFFETMSGLTATGGTVLSGVEALPPSINLWRHELNWLGGMGVIIMAVAILPLLGVGGMQLYEGETSGPLKNTQLAPRVAQTAKALGLVYLALTVVCILALKSVGMNWLDAICHAFATLSLGGFSTYDANIGHFDSPAIEAVLIFFMLIAGLNFSTHFFAWRGRSLRGYWVDIEARAYFAVIASSTLICAFYLWWSGTYTEFLTSLRHVAFNLVSIATDCGFTSQDFDRWPLFVPLWMLFLSCVSVCSGSTGGGIKMLRTLILAQQGLIELKRLVHPHLVAPMAIGKTVVSSRIAGAVLGFIFLYILSVGELTFFLVASGLDFISAISAVLACINNVGPGLNVVGPGHTFASLSAFQLWVCSFAMLLGRLEVLSLFVLFTPAFWRR